MDVGGDGKSHVQPRSQIVDTICSSPPNSRMSDHPVLQISPNPSDSGPWEALFTLGPPAAAPSDPPLCFLPHNTVTHSSVNAEHLGGLAMSGQSELSWQIPMKCHSAAALSIQALSDSRFSCSSLRSVSSSPICRVCFSPTVSVLSTTPVLSSPVNQIILHEVEIQLKSWQLRIERSGYLYIYT